MENIDIDIDKEIAENIDIDKISYRLEFGISNRATPTPMVKGRVGVKILLSMCSLMHLSISGVSADSPQKYFDCVFSLAG